MPSVDASKNILSVGANYAASDWASAAFGAHLDLLAQAELKRGFDIGVGAEAGVVIEGGLSKFLSAGVQAQANAAVNVRAQVQVPLDLFNEAGLAIRLQALAEAAVGVSLRVGLSVGDFIALAKQDPKMKGVPFSLLEIFLSELEINGGVMAKAAASAMAFANISMTGSLIGLGASPPGFHIAAEAGLGLAAGAGFRVFAGFNLADPRRLVRRSIDVAVNGSIDALSPLMPDNASRRLLTEINAPAKIALRTAFELGLATVENQGRFDRNDGGKMALRCVQVALEEAQRSVLEHSLSFAFEYLRNMLQSQGFDDATWLAAAPERLALANRIRAIPDEPFEASQHNRDYWLALTNEASALGITLADDADAIPRPVLSALSLLWSSIELLFICVHRISDVHARSTLNAMVPQQRAAAFSGALGAQPAGAIRIHINETLNRAASLPLTQEGILQYLLSSVTQASLLTSNPALANILKLVTGKDDQNLEDALLLVFNNAGAFAMDATGTLSAQASLASIRQGLSTFITTRIEGDLRGMLSSTLAASDASSTYLNEVLISTMQTMTGPVFDSVLSWGSNNHEDQRALRELCSSLLMRLFGRSLVVLGDIMLTKTQAAMHDQLSQLATHINDTNGVATKLAQLTHLDRSFIAETMEDTLLVCADTFVPMSDSRRRHMRELLYQIIDTAPPPNKANAIEALRNEAMVPNVEAAIELALFLGEEIAGNFSRFIISLIERIGKNILDDLQDLILSIQVEIDKWLDDLQALVHQVEARLKEFLAEIRRLERAIDRANDAFLLSASNLLGLIGEAASHKDAMRKEIATFVAAQTNAALSNNDLYANLPKDTKKWVRDTIKGQVASLLDNALIDIVLDAAANMADESADFLDDIRAIEPGDNVAIAVSDIFLDHLDEAIRSAFGHKNPHLGLSLTVPFINLQIDIGVSIPLNDLIAVVRGVVRNIGQIDALMSTLAHALADTVTKQSALLAANIEHIALSDQKQRAEQHLADTQAYAPEIKIISPQPASVCEGQVTLKIRAEGLNMRHLGLEDGDQQRLYIWVNQNELPSDQLQTTTLATSANAEAILRPKIQQPIALNTFNPATLNRDITMFKPHLGAEKPLGTLPGRVRNFNRRAAASASIVSTATQRDGLMITAKIPLSLLHEGINTIVCAIVSGGETQRIEKTVSFLVAEAPNKSTDNKIIMPPLPILNAQLLSPRMRVAIAQKLGEQGISSMMPTPSTKPQKLAKQIYYPQKLERLKRIEQSRMRIKSALDTEHKNLKKMLDTVRQRDFRLAVIAPAVAIKQPAGQNTTIEGKLK